MKPSSALLAPLSLLGQAHALLHQPEDRANTNTYTINLDHRPPNAPNVTVNLADLSRFYKNLTGVDLDAVFALPPASWPKPPSPATYTYGPGPDDMLTVTANAAAPSHADANKAVAGISDPPCDGGCLEYCAATTFLYLACG
ncbi:hypothetical protein F5Y15DRAFT_420421 [Xylariaceae sp. FL0016]|nr:hypothetical protein F5Y15DRAFT_420421 [Xylariaceae sp. FL0016]